MVKNISKQINYLIKITDSVGIIEHCILDKPNYLEGYSVDDNARALQVCLRFKNQYPVLKKVLPIYFNFLKSAIKDDLLCCDLNSDLSWQNGFEIGGEHYGRSLAALGETIKIEPKISSEAISLFNQIYSSMDKKNLSHNRVLAQTILGLKNYHSEDIKFWADKLVKKYLEEKTNSWNWFEPILSYDIGRMPLALLTAYAVTNDPLYRQIGLESLDFLTRLTFDKKRDFFIFPGNKGWFTKSGSRNIFDQQSLEAGSITEVYSLAFKITKNKKYRDLAIKAFSWYEGNNIIKVKMINPKNGGVYDGFNEKEKNLNQGAESILSYLLAYKSIKLI